MYCAFSEETLEVLSQRESIRRQLASETGTGELFITYFHEKTQSPIPNFHDNYLVHLIRTTNMNLEFLQQIFVYFVSKYWQDKSFKLRPKYFKKYANTYNSLHTKK